MHRRIALSIALALSVVALSLMSSDSTAQAQQGRRRFSFDTGIVNPGPNRELRVAVVGDFNGDGADFIQFRQISYIEQGNIYKVASQNTTAPIRLMEEEGIFFGIDAAPDGDMHRAVRGVVLSSSRNVQVTVMIIDTSTRQVVTSYKLENVLVSS